MSDILYCLTPLYYTSKFFAQANYKFLHNPKRTVFLCAKSKIYSILLIMSLVFTVGLLRHRMKSFANHKNIVLQVLFFVGSVFLTSSVLLNNLINSDKMVKILNELIEVDKSLKKNGITINYKNERKIVTTLLILQFSLIICYYTIFVLFNTDTHFSEVSFADLIIFICFFLRKAVQTCVMIQVEVFTFLLKIRFDLLKINLTRNIGKKFYLPSILSQTAKLHQEINSIARNVNDFYTIPLLAIIVLNFMVFILLCYDLLHVGFDANETFMYESYIGVQIFLFFIVVYCCSISSNAVSEH